MLANLPYPCYTLPPTQHHSFFRNLPPLSKNFSSLLPKIGLFTMFFGCCCVLFLIVFFFTVLIECMKKGFPNLRLKDHVRQTIQYASSPKADCQAIRATRRAKHVSESHPFICLFLVIFIVLGFCHLWFS